MSVARLPRLLAIVALLLAVGAASAGEAQAHGTSLTPASRAYVCRYLDRDSPPCAYAWKTRPQAMYDWMGIRDGEANGRHPADGKLCSAGDPEFAVYDRPSDDWLATELTPGRQTFRWTLNAPHATRYYRFYITKDGYDPTQPLRWSDLERFYDSGPRPAAKAESFAVDVPARTGRHLIYGVWQRSDSPEAFYSCSDVVFGERGQVPKDPPQPDEAANQPGHDHGDTPGMGTTAKPRPLSSKGIRLTRKVDSDWGSGYCATVTVTNRSRRTRAWKAAMRFADTLTGLWNAKHRVTKGKLRVRGGAYNRTLKRGARTTFGFCATRR